MSKPRFIVFEGMDNCGKSSQIQRLCEREQGTVVEIKFPKTLPSGALLRMNTEKDFEILFSMFELLDTAKVYVLDRFIPSNIVYDDVLRHENTELSEFYWNEFNRRFRVLTIVLTRPPIASNFVDDRIRLTKDQFNAALLKYKKFGPNFQLLERDLNDQPSGINQHIQDHLDVVIENFCFKS